MQQILELFWSVDEGFYQLPTPLHITSRTNAYTTQKCERDSLDFDKTAGGSSNEEHCLGRSAEKYASVTPSQRNDEKLNTIDDTEKKISPR